MPKISTAGFRPNFTTLTKSQTAINKNAMVIKSPTTNLGHLGIVLHNNKYKSANGNKAWKDPVEPPIEPVKHTVARGEKTDPYEAQEAIRAWREEKDNYTTFLITNEAIKA